MKRERSSREKIPAAHSVQASPEASPEICQRATNPLLVTDPSLVKRTLMIPVVDAQLFPLDNTEFPDSSASSTGESHDVAPLDDTQLCVYVQNHIRFLCRRRRRRWKCYWRKMHL